jgi:hypothetical protein
MLMNRWLARRRAVRPSRVSQQRCPLRAEELEPRNLLSGLTPVQVRHAYGVDQLAFTNSSNQAVAADGSGQTIAVITAYDDSHIGSDLDTFDRTYGINGGQSLYSQYGSNSAFLTVHKMANHMFSSSDWAVETSLDVEWAHAIAPGARILLVEASSSFDSSLLAAVDYAKSQPNVSAITMSWGGAEFSGQMGSNYDGHFVTPQGHQGITFLAASGDNGSPAIWPATSPNVVGVGGTTLALDASNNIVSETAWSGSGGGVSLFEPTPGYQSQYLSSPDAKRSSPDVAYNADLASGVAVYDRGWWIVGGTSAGSPQWAGLVTIANQGRVLAGNTTLDGPSQTLYALYQMGTAANSSHYFNDITSGTNGGFTAGTGYDKVTGLGSPVAFNATTNTGVVTGLVQATGTGPTLTFTATTSTSANLAPHFVVVVVNAPPAAFLLPTNYAPVAAVQVTAVPPPALTPINPLPVTPPASSLTAPLAGINYLYLQPDAARGELMPDDPAIEEETAAVQPRGWWQPDTRQASAGALPRAETVLPRSVAVAQRAEALPDVLTHVSEEVWAVGGADLGSTSAVVVVADSEPLAPETVAALAVVALGMGGYWGDQREQRDRKKWQPSVN